MRKPQHSDTEHVAAEGYGQTSKSIMLTITQAAGTKRRADTLGNHESGPTPSLAQKKGKKKKVDDSMLNPEISKALETQKVLTIASKELKEVLVNIGTCLDMVERLDKQLEAGNIEAADAYAASRDFDSDRFLIKTYDTAMMAEEIGLEARGLKAALEAIDEQSADNGAGCDDGEAEDGK